MKVRQEPLAAGPEPVRLTPEHDYRVRRLPLAWYVERIRRRDYFSYTKINHRFWELEAELHRNPPGRSPEARAAADHALGRVAYLETGFREELLADLGTLPLEDPSLVFATSHEGYPGSCRLEGATPDPAAIFAVMNRLLPRGLVPHDGMLFKRATISGEILAFYRALRDLPLLVVGPEWLSALAGRFDLPNATHLAIPSREARAERWELLERIAAAREAIGAETPAAVIFEAGTLAPWLIRRLHGRVDHTFLIDVGRPLDVCRPAIVFRHNWARVFRRELAENLGVIDPRVRDSRSYFAGGSNASAASKISSSAKPSEIERFEREGAELLELPDETRLVATASGPAALRTLTRLETLRTGKPLRWVAPAWMDSKAATVSAIARARRLDTDARGLLDARALAGLDPNAWHGAIVSDPFGLAESFEPVARVCRRFGKSLVVEGFAAFDAIRRRRTGRLPEALCLDVERPWGAAALGLMAVSLEDEASARELVAGGGNATPCPASEAAVLAVRERLLDLTQEGTRRHLQYKRLAGFAAELGWTVLGPHSTLERCATPSAIPLLAPGPLDPGAFRMGRLGLQPAAPAPGRGGSVADSLHARLLRVPCDARLEQFSNDEIRAELRAALPRVRTIPRVRAVSAARAGL